jgi:uncharacterized protein YeaO (DUF488 family)
MINIYTSCFKSAKRLDSSKYFVVSISRFPPQGFPGYKCFEFAPSADLLKRFKGGLSKYHYAIRYRKDVLEKINVHQVFEGLAKLACGRDIVLCCFEPAFDFCHRRLLAMYVKELFGYSIEELI